MMSYSQQTSDIMKLFLFGSTSIPEDLLNPDIIHRGAPTPYSVDVNEFMESGAGRFALPTFSPIVQFLFSSSATSLLTPSELADLANGLTVTLSKAEVATRYGNFPLDLAQADLQDSIDDYAERTWVFNNGTFQTTDFSMVFRPDGSKELQNFAVMPREAEDFDLDGAGLSQLVNPTAGKLFDPSGIGQTLPIVFTGTRQTTTYNKSQYDADQATINSFGGLNLFKLGVDGYSLLSQFWNDGITKTLDKIGRPILYGDAAGGQIDADSANEFGTFLRDYAENGIAIVGSNQDDDISSTMEASSLFGNGGNDVFSNVGGLNSIASGGAGDDQFVLSAAADYVLIVGGEGADRIEVSSASIEKNASVLVYGGAGADRYELAIGEVADYRIRSVVDDSALDDSEIESTIKNNVWGNWYDGLVILNSEQDDVLVIDGVEVGNVVYSMLEDHGWAQSWSYLDDNFRFHPIFEEGIPCLQIYRRSDPEHSASVIMTIVGFRNGQFGINISGGNPPLIVIHDPDNVAVGWELERIEPEGWNEAGAISYDLMSDLTVVRGTDGNDQLEGSSENDRILAAAGDDTIVAGHGGGDDFYHGGSGYDWIVFPSTAMGVHVDLQSREAYGDEIGFDVIMAVEAVMGGAGSDVLSGDANDNALSGAEGNDVLEGRDGSDHLAGGDGDDALYGQADDDILIGGAGADLLNGGDGNDTYFYNRGDGHDEVTEGANGGNADVLHLNGVNAYTQTIVSALGLDLLIAIDPSTPGGSDGGSIRVKNYFDMAGDYGVETIADGDSNVFTKEDVFLFLYGNSAGGLSMTGTSGSDVFIGTAQEDAFDGDAGDDFIEGGGGDDWLMGGSGADTFIFRSGFGQDGIGDLEVGVDTLEIHDQGALDFAGLMVNAEEWGGNAWLHFDGGNRVILYGVALDDLSASDFRFV